MARITPSALIDDIKGSVGGVTFSSWKGMSYVKSKAKSVRNPATNVQVQIREAMTFFSRRFFDDLTDAQRAEWDQYAQEIAGAARAESVQGGFGLRVVPQRSFNCSGYNWYIRINVRMRREVGVAIYTSPVDDAPLGQTPPGVPSFNGVTYDNTTGKFSWSGHAPQDFGHATTVRVSLWGLPNWGYARVQKAVVATAENEEIDGVEVATWDIQRTTLAIPLPDGIYAFQMDAVGLQNGLVSPPSDVVKVAAKFVGV